MQVFQKGGKRVKHIYVGEKVGGTGSYMEAESVSCEVPPLTPAEGGLPNILRLFLGESVNCHWQCEPEVPALRIPAQAVEPEGGGASGAY